VTGAIGDITTFATAEEAGGTITAATNYAVNVNTGTATVDQVNAIDQKNGTGVITATISDHLIATLANLSTGTNHAYTVSVTDAASIAQLTTLDAKTSVTLTYAALSDSIGNLIADAATNSNNGTYVKSGHDANVTDTASISQLSTIDNLVATVTYTSITDTAANLETNTGTYVVGNHSAIVSDTGTVTAAQLNAIDALTAGLVDASLATTVMGTAAAVYTALVTNSGTGSNQIKHTNTVNVTISDSPTIAQLQDVDGLTGTVTYTSITDTAAHLATPSTTAGVTTWTANAYITSGKNVFITGNIDPAELTAIDAANGAGTVTLLDSRLSAPNSYTTVTSLTPPGITTNNTVAKIYDAAGDQTFEIAAGGKLVLESVQGHNVIKFDGYAPGTLSVSHSASTVIFTDSITNQQIASIAMSAQGDSQTITYSDNSHVELTLTGTTFALGGVPVDNTGTIL
jgi:hypothetical protein